MRTTSKNRTNLFFSGVLILTISNLLIKLIGMMYKIPLAHILDDYGMGIFNAAYQVYVWFYMISTAGLPIAVSILISESRARGNFKETKRIFKITMLLFLAIGLFGMSVMIFGSGFFSKHFIGNPECFLSIIAIAPTLFFICISSAVRGYFQGYQNMFPTAISQLIEALGKLVLGILFAKYAIDRGYPLYIVAAFSIAGLTVGAAVGMIFLVISKLFFKSDVYDLEYVNENSEAAVASPTGKIIKRLIVLAVPITISASVMSLTNLIDVVIINRGLISIGFTAEEATALYGNYTGLCVPMYNFPPILIYPISYSIIPLISAANEAKDRIKAQLVMNSSLRVTAVLAIPCALGLSVMAEPILKLLYRAEQAEKAAPYLSILALSVFFVCMLSITNAMLQACKHERKPIYSMLTGAAVKLVTSFILIRMPIGNGSFLGMYGTPISTFLCYLVITVMNFAFLAKYVGVIPNVTKVFIKPLGASIICIGFARVFFEIICNYLPYKLSTLIAIASAVPVYVVMTFLIKAIDKDDVLLLPKGKKIYAILHKIKLV